MIRRATAGALASGLVTQASLVGSGIIGARLLGPENRGYFALLILVPAILGQLGTLGMPQAVAYYIARDPGSVLGIVRFVTRQAMVQIAVLIPLQLAVLFWLFERAPSEVRSAGWVTVVALVAVVVQDYSLAVLQGQHRYGSFNLLRALPQPLNTAALVIALLTDARRMFPIVSLVMCAYAIWSAAMLVTALRALPREATPRGSVPSRSEFWAFGLRGMVGSIYPIEAFRIDQFLVGILLNPTALGIYVVAQAMANLPRYIAESVGKVAYPHITALRRMRDQRVSMWRFLGLVVALALPPVILVGATLNWLVPLLFGSAFAGASPVARWLLVASLLAAARRILSEGARGAGLPLAGTIAEIATLASLGIALALLLQPFGVQGMSAAMAFAGAVGLFVILVIDFTQLRPHSGRDALIEPSSIEEPA